MCEGGGRGGEGGGRAFYTYNNKAVRYERGHGPCGKKKKVNDALQSGTVNLSCFGLTHRELASSPHTLIWPRTTAVP